MGLTMYARPLMATLLALSLAPPLWAQAGSGGAERPGPVFRITGFDVAGVNPLAVGETSNILAPFLRADATIETLQKATAALETALKERGYGLYRVSLLPQELSGGIVKLEIVRYLVGKVVLEGATNHSESNIRASVPELVEGQTPNFRTLAVQTAIANESQGKQIQVVLKESTQPDTIDARVVVKESKDWNFAVSLNNSGTKATGHDRFSLVGGHANLFDLDHSFSAAYTTSLARASDVRQLGLNYKIPLYKLGGVLGFSHTRSDVTGSFGPFSSNGAGQTMGLSYSHYLHPEGGRRSNITLGLDDKQFDPTLINGVPVPGQLERRTRPLSLGYNVRVETDKSAYGYNLDLVANLAGGAGNNLTAYQSEDPRIRTASFRLLRAGANYLGALGSGWMLGLRGQAQYSSNALISGEQFGIGGAQSVRGTGERPVSGDRGIFGSAEFTSPELRPGLRWAGFVDAGFVASDTSPASPKLASDRLASFGLGLRYSVGRVSASAEWARLFMGSKVPLALNSESPQKGDHKLHVNLSIRF
jgi:hemolysin activation/secretion protein